jgi:VanZ like family
MTPWTPILGALRRTVAPLAKALRQPTHWVKVVAVTSALLLAANVLWHGAQPYAVGLVPNGWDKVAHATLHFVLCTVLLFALGLRRGWWAVALCSAFAAIDEWAQQFSPGRSVSFYDWLASDVGAVLGLAFAHALAWFGEMSRLRHKSRMNEAMARWLRPPSP